MYEHIAAKLARGDIIILDGGTGTDIQRRGATMSGDTWCAEANMTHPDIVCEVHRDYVKAGADMVIANTFATSALLFNALGRDDELLAIDRAAVALAQQAVAGQAGGGGGVDLHHAPGGGGLGPHRQAAGMARGRSRALFARKANNLAAAGVDLIIMEMMRDVRYSLWATEAALATGLPVWVGIATERRADGELVGFSHGRIAGRRGARARGHRASPHQHHAFVAQRHGRRHRHRQAALEGADGRLPGERLFHDARVEVCGHHSPENLVEHARGWQGQGVTAFGGCCGLGPQHIAALPRGSRSWLTQFSWATLNRDGKAVKRAQLALPCRHVQSLPSSERTRAPPALVSRSAPR